MKLTINNFQLTIYSAVWLLLMVNCSLAMDNPEQRAAAVIKDYIAAKNPDWRPDEIRLTFKLAENTFESMKNLPENAELKVLEIYPEFKPVGAVIFPLSISTGEGFRKVMLRAQVKIIKRIASAARAVKKGKTIEAADLKLEERDIALLPPKYFSEVNPIIGKEAKLSIPANSTLFDWMVGEIPLVRRSTEVSILVNSAGLTVKARGEALEDGYLGSEIKVKRKDSSKIVSGKIISPNEVEVRL